VSYNYWNVYFPFKEVKEEKKRLVWVLKLETQAVEEYKVKYEDYKKRAPIMVQHACLHYLVDKNVSV
jgi:hypothetical protein